MGALARRSAGSMTDWKRAPKMAGEMAAQSKRQASISATRIAASKSGMVSRAANRSPLT